MSNEEKLNSAIFNVVMKLPSGVTRTQLIKLLYLIDISCSEKTGKPLTGLTYRSYHYGPFSEEIYDAIDELKGYEIEEHSRFSRDGREYYLYTPGMNPRWETLPTLQDEEAEAIEEVISVHGDKPLDELLKYVYNTEPYKKCKKGGVIALTSNV